MLPARLIAVISCAWLAVSTVPAGDTLAARFPAPDGYRRVAVAAGSFGAYLRELPLLPPGTPVRAYDGRILQAPAVAVVDLDVGTGDLQQCADTVLRLHAEYLFAGGRADEIAYRFTSGDLVPFARWARGERPVVRGNRVTWTTGAAAAADHRALRAYLDTVFTYAGTRSLGRDATAITLDRLAPGDLFVEAGSPGHAVIVLDVAVAADGSRRVLLGQGYMPAQNLHVLRAPDGGAWFAIDPAAGGLLTPSWPRPFAWNSLRRLPGTAGRP